MDVDPRPCHSNPKHFCLVFYYTDTWTHINHGYESSRFPRNFILFEPEIGWKLSRVGQVMT